ncbi:hypothetical protein [Symbioplanes lichenis]|uniref:hypothetical protein n=1 Tax=Symbioplanes lichenis TaxID=1629072 RepID=UPI00273A1CA1|nr:hypothetical protein [Actinoplanes lichenis]
MLVPVVAVLSAAFAVNTIPGTGAFVVGQDVPAGIYRSTGNTSCYWERARNASGTTASIISNDIGSGQRLAQIRATDKIFRTRNCRTWVRVLSPTLRLKSRKVTIPGDGAYFAGSDFRPGTYRSTGNTGHCYWERAKNADGTSSGIIANGLSQGQLIVTVAATDFVFRTSGCKPWTRLAG